MSQTHVTAGILLLAATLGYFGARFLSAPKQAPFPARGWMGLAIVLASEVLLFAGVRWVGVFFTALAWTGYLLFIDALVWTLKGQSRLVRQPRQFVFLALSSVPLWLIFEAYNLRLQNWTYVGLPESGLVRGIGYVWAFATIWPAIFETADFIRALGIGRQGSERGIRLSASSRTRILIVGALLLALPLIVPAGLARYLFGPVWLGFIFLLDPVNYRWNGHSLLGELERGETATLWSFLVAGWVCGILWEFWNYWAKAKWLYVFPIWQSEKIFEMPLPGYVGFPFFALECFAMYEFLNLLGKRLAGLGGRAGWRQVPLGAGPRARPQASS